METVKLTEAKNALVRQRVLGAVQPLLARGEAWTFASLAAEAGVPERTIYRHFGSREALVEELFKWINEQLGFSGDLGRDAQTVTATIRRAFPGFDAFAPVVKELLVAPEGRAARLANKSARQRAMLAAARSEAPGLNATDTRRVAALLQLLASASTWQSLRDYWDMDGVEAAETAALGVALLLRGAGRAKSPTDRAGKSRIKRGQVRS